MGHPLYGSIKADNALDSVVRNVGYREITTITAGDASHTLDNADGGTIFITAALASAAVIKLPEATIDRIGLKYRVVMGGTLAAAAKISLPDAKNSVFAGVITQERCGNAAGVAEHATAVRMTTIVCETSSAEKTMELDENDETFGGAIGTDLTFEYVDEDVVFVTGVSTVNLATTALDGLQATTFTGTGY